jgi:predicted DNA-binding transcriptional regulator YafY
MRNKLLKFQLEQTPVEMIYLSEKGICTKRIIIIKEIKDETLRAYCYYRQNMRTFKIDQILAIEKKITSNHLNII